VIILSVRAKFKCSSKTGHGDSSTVEFVPVYSGSAENESFYKATPGGSINLQVVNKNTADRFEVGKEYYIDFIPAE
jgi:hypothetical protein